MPISESGHDDEHGRSEIRYRALFDAIDAGFCIIEVLFDADGRAQDYRFVEVNAAFERQTGLHDAVGRRMRALAPDHEAYWFEIYGRIALTGEPQRFEHRAAALGHWYEVYAFRTGEPEERRVAILFKDIAARKEAERSLKESEERSRLLLGELQHRVRNTLAVVRSIGRRTAESSDTVEDYAMHLDGRIAAFARIQAAVTRDPAKGVGLAAIVADTLQVAAAREGEQVLVAGPPVTLRPKAAETFGLALHELTTNAVKYGALAIAEGRISIAWDISEAEDEEGDGVLDFRWRETGLAGLAGPSRRSGFGTELLEKTLNYELGAETSITFEPDGVDCRIRVPLGERVLWRG